MLRGAHPLQGRPRGFWCSTILKHPKYWAVRRIVPGRSANNVKCQPPWTISKLDKFSSAVHHSLPCYACDLCEPTSFNQTQTTQTQTLNMFSTAALLGLGLVSCRSYKTFQPTKTSCSVSVLMMFLTKLRTSVRRAGASSRPLICLFPRFAVSPCPRCLAPSSPIVSPLVVSLSRPPSLPPRPRPRLAIAQVSSTALPLVSLRLAPCPSGPPSDPSSRCLAIPLVFSSALQPLPLPTRVVVDSRFPRLDARQTGSPQ